MEIAFVLPAPVRVPMGGAAVVYRHARGLAARGHRVTIIAPQTWGGAKSAALRALVSVRDRLHGVAAERPYRDHAVRVVEPRVARASALDRFDTVIATGHQTALAVSRSSARGFYFVQGDERALSPRARRTWDLPLARVTVSGWLRRLLEGEGYAVEGVVPNAVDTAVFSCREPIPERPARLVALYHRHPVKGPETLIRALVEVRKRLPGVAATVIAARPPRHSLPSWVEVTVRPSPDDLGQALNRSGVCLHTSTVEGWGLLPMEAAACGCAVVATASRGPREYLAPGRSMIEVGVGDAEALAAGAVSLLQNPTRRAAMAEAALEDVGRFSWASSTDAFERLLIEGTS